MIVENLSQRLVLFAICCLTGSLGCAEHLSRTDGMAQIESGAAPRVVDVRSAVGPVLFMEGHMNGWKQDGLRIEKGTVSESDAVVTARE
jgi:hypothetical protein